MSAPTLPLQTPAIAVKERGREAIRFENVTLAFDDKVVWTTFLSDSRMEKPRPFSGSQAQARAPFSSWRWG